MSLTDYPLYTSHAHLWPVLAPLESYESEMIEWSALVESHFAHDREIEMLDLGTGGGHHLYHLVNQVGQLKQGLAVDLSSQMLQRVKALLPSFETLQADMTNLKLQRQFEFISVHDSFCYLYELSQVKDLFSTIACHLSKGGLALVKIDALADSFEGPYRYLTTFEEDDFEVTLTHFEWDPDPQDTWLEVVYLFLERSGKEVSTREERHRLGLFYRSVLQECARDCGLNSHFHDLEPWDEDRENILLVLGH